MPRFDLRHHVAAVLADGPLSFDALFERVLPSVSANARDPRRAVNTALRARDFLEHEGSWWHVAALVASRTFTHRMTADELADETLLTGRDLTLLPLEWGSLYDSNRGQLEFSPDDVNVAPLSGPPGWLADLQPGDVVAVTLQGAVLSVSLVTDLAREPELDARLQELARAAIEEDEEAGETFASASVRDLVLPILLADPQAFSRPGLPFSERFGEELELYGGLVARRGANWSWFDRFDDDEDELDLQYWQRFGLSVDAAAAAKQVLDDAEVPRPSDDLLDRTADAMVLPGVADALTATVSMHETPMGLRDLLTDAAARATGTARAACLVALAAAEEGYVQGLAAEEALLAAVEADPHYEPALTAAARYAEYRGDAARAVDLLKRTGVASNSWRMQRLRHFADPPPSTISRNAPCPCGSGRKHKACCLTKATHPLSARSRWLRDKLVTYALEPSQRGEWLEYAECLVGEQDSLLDLIFDPFVQDLGIWGTELLDGFPIEQEEIVPDDELALLAQWGDVQTRLYELVSINHRAMTLRDVDEDTLVTAAHSLGITELRQGELLLTRVLPDGEQGWITGGLMPIPRLWRSRLAPFLRDEPHDSELAEWISEALQPPTVLGRDGTELVLCVGRWQVEDPAATVAALEEELDLFEGNGTLYDEDGQLVLEVNLVDDILAVSSLSRENWPAIEAFVARVIPTAVELDRKETDSQDLQDLLPYLEREEPVTGEMREVLLAHMQDYERTWVDEPVPALGGSSPREALKDEAKRKELLELLADMDVHQVRSDDPETAMSGDRVRKLLGLS